MRGTIRNRHLIHAAKHGDAEKVLKLIAKGADIHIRHHGNGWTPLQYAIAKGDAMVVGVLLNEGAGDAGEDIYESRLLAERYGHDHIIDMLNAKRDEVVARNSTGDNKFAKSLKVARNNTGDNKFAKSPKEESIVELDPNEELLFEAAKDGDVAGALRLLGKGANVNVKEYDGFTPLHWACYTNHVEVVEALLDNGAHIGDSTKKYKETPLHIASGNGYAEIVNVLHARGADINATDSDGATPLHMAFRNLEDDVAMFLIAKGANVNVKDSRDETPLHSASYEGQADVVQALLDKGADIDPKDKNGRTPLLDACCNGQIHVVKILLTNGCDVNAKDKNGLTSLHWASRYGHADVVKVLIDKGAAFDSKNDDGDTPIDEAKAFGRDSIVTLFGALEIERKSRNTLRTL